jgi:hypothetical protein
LPAILADVEAKAATLRQSLAVLVPGKDSSGKADTSRFGFFGGPSLRVTPWIFLTPGVHLGEFAGFPQGFNRPGQVIPANTGTPIPTKRFTGKFAFSITFKIRDLGASTGSNEAKPK